MIFFPKENIIVVQISLKDFQRIQRFLPPFVIDGYILAVKVKVEIEKTIVYLRLMDQTTSVDKPFVKRVTFRAIVPGQSSLVFGSFSCEINRVKNRIGAPHTYNTDLGFPEYMLAEITVEEPYQESD